MQNVVCHACNQKGHYKRNCPNLQQSSSREGSHSRPGKRKDRDFNDRTERREPKKTIQCCLIDTPYEDTKRSNDIPMCLSADSGGAKRRKIIVDSGATSHSLPLNDPDITATKPKDVTITLADGTKDRVTTSGQASIDLQHTGRTKGTTKLELSDVLLMSDVPHGIFSVTRAVDAGCTLLFKKTHATLQSPDGYIIALQRDPNTGLYLVRNDE